MAEGNRTGGGEGLSLQTLVVAAGASALAAIVVSHLWRDGTVIAAAMTPVIVAIAKELLTRPMESELVRKPVQQVGRLASSGRLTAPGRARTGSSGETRVLPPTEERPAPAAPGNGGAPPTGDGEGITPIRTYGRNRRRPMHLKIALVTGLVAFVIAAAALTLPELIFGGAISSHHSTTLFGGSSKSKSDKSSGQKNGNTSTQPQKSKPQNGQTTPAAPPASGGTTKPPPTSGSSSTTPQSSPQQTAPQQTSPVPTTPTPPAP
jgi:uncharacterized membrane protein YvlD (DUF360 family)